MLVWIQVDKDEHPRPETTEEALAKLRPAFDKEGTVTAGNASGKVVDVQSPDVQKLDLSEIQTNESTDGFQTQNKTGFGLVKKWFLTGSLKKYKARFGPFLLK